MSDYPTPRPDGIKYPVPNATARVNNDNFLVLDNIVCSDEDSTTNRTGNSVLTISGMAKKFGWIIAGDFYKGFTIESRNELGLDAAGKTWRWNGALPHVVSAGAAPVSPDWDQIEIGIVIIGETPHHNDLEGRGEVNAHPSSSISVLDQTYTDAQDMLSTIEIFALAGL